MSLPVIERRSRFFPGEMDRLGERLLAVIPALGTITVNRAAFEAAIPSSAAWHAVRHLEKTGRIALVSHDLLTRTERAE
jgi:hypothetical protein